MAVRFGFWMTAFLLPLGFVLGAETAIGQVQSWEANPGPVRAPVGQRYAAPVPGAPGVPTQPALTQPTPPRRAPGQGTPVPAQLAPTGPAYTHPVAAGAQTPAAGPARTTQVPNVTPRQVVEEVQRQGQPLPAVAPFQLTPKEQAFLDWVLQSWEQHSTGVKTFECDFKRWEFNLVFGNANKPLFEDIGKLKYAAPDRGSFEIKGNRPEKWVCDGKSVYEYKHAQKQVVQHKLPPELQGKAISNGPLPFLFGAKAAELKQRYFLRVITPKNRLDQGEVWLEAFPRHQADAANFSRAELILKTKGMVPHALQISDPGGTKRTAYQFYNTQINDPFQQFFRINPFVAPTPPFWRKVVEEPPAPQVSRQPAATTTR